MDRLAHLRLGLKIAAALGVAYCGWVFTARSVANADLLRRLRHTQQPARNPEFDRAYGGSAVKILNFYARDGNMIEGDGTVLCYGVVNAKSVRIEPPVDGVWPALNRCVAVSPEQDTRYTLIAEGKDGRAVSESFVLPVKPDYESFPKVTSFRVARHDMERTQHVFLLSFTTSNALEVSIDPPVFPTLHGAPYSRFYVAPKQTTTYTLTALGKKGRKAKKQLTVEVPAK